MNSPFELAQGNESLRVRLAEAEETLRAIRAGDVDAMIIGGEVYSLKGAETPYRLLVEAMNEGAAAITEDGTLFYANSQLAELVRVPLEELLELSLQSLVRPDDQTVFGNLLKDGQNGRGSAELNLCCRGAAAIPVQVSLRLLSSQPRATLSVVITDLRMRKGVENELRHVNRALRTISRGNQSLVRAKTEPELLLAMCRAAVDEGGFRRAWVYYADDSAQETLRIVAQAGLNSEQVALGQVTEGDSRRERDLARRCVSTRQCVILHDNVNDAALGFSRERGQRTEPASLLAIPLMAGEAAMGAIIFYSTDLHVFDEAEVAVLKELAGDLSFGILALRTREARLQAETLLRESESYYRSLFQNMLNGYALCHMVYKEGRADDFVYVAVNEAFETLTGLKDVTGRKASEVIPGIRERDGELLDIYGRVAATGEPARVERYVQSMDMWFALSVYSPKKDHFVAVFDVITERKRAEAKLRQSEERYRLVFEGARDGIFSVAATGMITALNPAFETITGWPRDRWIGKPFNDVIYPGDRGRAVELFGQALRGEATPTVELRVRTAAGGVKVVEFTGFSSHLAEVGAEVQGIGRDITERKDYEHRLREKVEIINSAHEGVMIVSGENLISFWNKGAERIFGYSGHEALGRAPHTLLGAMQLGATKTLEKSVERAGYWHGEIKCQTRDGRERTVECRVTLLRDEAGRPAGRLHFLSDITEKKLLEEKFLHTQRLESLGMLAAGIAHDLNNTLAPIMFAAPMLRERLSDPADLKLMDTLARSAERGAGLVKQILGFSRTTTGEFVPTQIKHVARDVVNVVEETFPKSIEVEHRVGSDLWPVLGNATQIHQVLLNLCVNARDAMPHGGKLRLKVENRRLNALAAGAIAHARPGAWVYFEVSDSGTGIAPDLLESIWTPFFTTKGPNKGTGLGLSTVRAVVEQHRGVIALQTAVGVGSTFQVFLPALEDEPRGPASNSPFAVARGGGQSVLVVDDNTPIREIVTALLKQAGYRVANCVDGVDAVEFLTNQSEDIDLLITDVDMPRMGGVALAQFVLQRRPNVRIIAMSGLSRHNVDEPGVPEIKEIAHAFLLKPFEAPELLSVVRRLVDASENYGGSCADVPNRPA